MAEWAELERAGGGVCCLRVLRCCGVASREDVRRGWMAEWAELEELPTYDAEKLDVVTSELSADHDAASDKQPLGTYAES